MLAQQLGDLAIAAPGGLLRERTLVGKSLAFLPFAPFVLPALWGWFRIAQRVWKRRWPQPCWYARVLWTGLYTAVLLWGWASLSRGLTPNSQEADCRYAGQRFDSDYFYSHRGPLPPLLVSSPCNRSYDLVPGWINPAIVICLLMTITALVATVASSLRAAARAADNELDGAARGDQCM